MARNNTNPLPGGEVRKAFEWDGINLRQCCGQVALGGAASVLATAGAVPANFIPLAAALRCDVGGVTLTTATRLALGLAAAMPFALCLSGTSMAAQAQTVQRFGSPGLIFSQRVATAANAPAANTESAFVFSPVVPTIPANLLRPGDIVRISCQVITTAINATDTVTVKLKDVTGGNIILASAAPQLSANDITVMRADLQIRKIGATGTYVSSGLSYNGTNAVVAGAADIPTGGFLASTAIDTTAALQLGASVTFSTNSATNSARCDSFTIEIIRPQPFAITAAAAFPLVTCTDDAGTLTGTGVGNVSYSIWGYEFPALPSAII